MQLEVGQISKQRLRERGYVKREGLMESRGLIFRKKVGFEE